jgi:hypothetical protein
LMRKLVDSLKTLKSLKPFSRFCLSAICNPERQSLGFRFQVSGKRNTESSSQ